MAHWRRARLSPNTCAVAGFGSGGPRSNADVPVRAGQFALVMLLLLPECELVAGVATPEGGLHVRLNGERRGGGGGLSLWPHGWRGAGGGGSWR